MKRIGVLLLCALGCSKGTPPAPVAVDAGFDYGKYASTVKGLRDALAKEPCDKRQALMLGDLLNRANDYRGASAYVGEFETACGAWVRLRWARQYACEQSEDWACAAQTATTLIADTPTDSDFWWWRGQAEAHLDHYERAEADYFQSMANKPTGFPAFRLAQFAKTKLSRPCDGALLIQWWIEHGKRTTEDWIDPTRARLFLDGACDKNCGTGTAQIPVAPNAPLVRATAKIDGVTANVLIDERTGYLVLTGALAEKAKLPEASAQRVEVLAAGEIHEGPLTTVKKLQLGAASVGGVRAVVLDTLPEGVDAIVGLNVLMQFSVKHDAKGFTLAPLPK